MDKELPRFFVRKNILRRLLRKNIEYECEDNWFLRSYKRKLDFYMDSNIVTLYYGELVELAVWMNVGIVPFFVI